MQDENGTLRPWPSGTFPENSALQSADIKNQRMPTSSRALAFLKGSVRERRLGMHEQQTHSQEKADERNSTRPDAYQSFGDAGEGNFRPVRYVLLAPFVPLSQCPLAAGVDEPSFAAVPLGLDHR
jgi:hypothetical protein